LPNFPTLTGHHKLVKTFAKYPNHTFSQKQHTLTVVENMNCIIINPTTHNTTISQTDIDTNISEIIQLERKTFLLTNLFPIKRTIAVHLTLLHY